MTHSLLLLVGAGIAKAVMDSIQFRGLGKGSRYWDGKISWQNKWRNPEANPIYRIERFPGSSTIFVFLTDGWHLMQFIQIKLLVLAIVLYAPRFHWAIDFLILHAVYTGTFQLFYGFIIPRVTR